MQPSETIMQSVIAPVITFTQLIRLFQYKVINATVSHPSIHLSVKPS